MTLPETAERPVRRFWWLKRLGLAGGVAIAMLAGLWGGEDWYYGAKLKARNAALVKSGSDLQPAAIPDEDNAAFFLKKAAGTMAGVDTPGSSGIDFDSDLPPRPEWTAMAKQSAAANAKAMEIAKQAMACRHADWGTRFTSPVTAVMLPHLAPQRQLAIVMADAAILAHVEGDDAEALTLIRTMLHQGRMLREERVVISQMVGMAIESLAHSVIIEVAGDLRVEGNETTERTVGRREIEALIAELLANDADRTLSASEPLERFFTMEMLEFMRSDSWVARPVHTADAVDTLRRLELIAMAMKCPTLPEAKSFLTAHSIVFDERSPWQRNRQTDPQAVVDPVIFYRSFVGWFGNTQLLRRQYRFVCGARMAAIKLACRLYTLDQGRFPESLDRLVPKYLREVPKDPLAADGRAIGVVFAAGNRPIAYSVGEDGVDQTVHQGSNAVAEFPGRALIFEPLKEGAGSDDLYVDLASHRNPEPRKPLDPPPALPPGMFLPAPSTQPDTDQNAKDADRPGDQQKTDGEHQQ